MKHRKFPSPQIAEAVFRGKKTPYSFEVYPLNIEFNEVPAVYIISKRKIDKYGRAHHAIVHLGQTESLAAEVKNQRKGKSIKEYQANAVSVLLTENEKSRLAIEADLKSAYALRCLRKPENKKPVVLRTQKFAPTPETRVEKPKGESLKAKTPVKPQSAGKIEVSRTKVNERIEKPKSKLAAKKPLKAKATKPETSQKSKTVEKKAKNKVASSKNDLALKPAVKTKKKVEILKPATAKKTDKQKQKGKITSSKTNSAKKAEVKKGRIKALEPQTAKKTSKQPNKTKLKREKKVVSPKVKTIKKPIRQKAKSAVKPKKKAEATKLKKIEKVSRRKVKTSPKPKAKAKSTKVTSQKKTETLKTKMVNSKVKATTGKAQKTSAKLKSKAKNPKQASIRTVKPKKAATAKTKPKITKKAKTPARKSISQKARAAGGKKQNVRLPAKNKKANVTGKTRHPKTTSRKRLAF